MNTYIVSYDLKNALAEDYERIFNYFQSFTVWARVTESLWVISSEKTSIVIRDELIKYMPINSRVLVIKSGKEAAWSNVMCSSDWLQKYL